MAGETISLTMTWKGLLSQCRRIGRDGPSGAALDGLLKEFDRLAAIADNESTEYEIVRRASSLQPGVQRVEFAWSTEHGECLDCGRPAAYTADIYQGKGAPEKFCSVCAAGHAADGCAIKRLFEDI